MKAINSNGLKGIWGTLVLAAGIMTLGGCNTVNPPLEPRQDPYDQPRIVYTDPWLRLHTAMDAPDVRRDDAGLLFVVATIRNTTNDKFDIRWRVTFFDNSGALLYHTDWQRQTLEPNIAQYIRFNSTTNRAQEYQLDLAPGDGN